MLTSVWLNQVDCGSELPNDDWCGLLIVNFLKGVSSSGKTRAFKALDAGSIPATLERCI